MTLHQFNQLEKSQQRICILTEGTFLDERCTGHHDVMLYELCGFYAEAYFVKNTNKPAFFKTFTGTQKLEPYLSQINLDDLLQQISL